jgi:hypothetical protein
MLSVLSGKSRSHVCDVYSSHEFNSVTGLRRSRDSSVSMTLGYGLDDRGSRVSARARNFSLHHRVQTGSGVHPASYQMGSRGPFPRGKASGT